MKLKLLMTLTVCLLTPLPLVAQHAHTCNPTVLSNTPTHRFSVQPDGTAVDLRTGLTWMRCPLGFAVDDAGTTDDYSDDACVETGGTSNMNWQAALETAAALNDGGGFASFTDWRLPNIKELVSIVERKCVWPALNTAVFPTVRFDKFWTSSTYNNQTHAPHVEFIYGQNDSSLKTSEWLVRLVR
jgi:hypothetical protein